MQADAHVWIGRCVMAALGALVGVFLTVFSHGAGDLGLSWWEIEDKVTAAGVLVGVALIFAALGFVFGNKLFELIWHWH